MYQQQGWKIKGFDADKVDFINIPVLANFYVAKGFALKIGLQPGFVVSADKGIKDDCNTFNLALPVGLSMSSRMVSPSTFAVPLPLLS